jgi:hypothetical protein
MTTTRELIHLPTVAIARHICRGHLDDDGRVLPLPHQHVAMDIPVLDFELPGTPADHLTPVGTIRDLGEVVLN